MSVILSFKTVLKMFSVFEANIYLHAVLVGQKTEIKVENSVVYFVNLKIQSRNFFIAKMEADFLDIFNRYIVQRSHHVKGHKTY